MAGLKGFAVGLLALSSCVQSSPQDFTIKITNLDRSSGGSGSLVFSNQVSSSVLTNGHVCEVIKSGGYVSSSQAEGIVSNYRISNQHDLCLIDVNTSLGDKATHLAPIPPQKFEDEIVSGHPRLLPTIITKGQFSEKQLIQVTTGFRDCTPSELENPQTGMFCVFVGKLPIIKAYEAVVVSSLIQPGSSGSAVYNTSGEVSAVIFAGAGEIGYGMAVPYEYLSDFLFREVRELPRHYPSMTLDIAAKPQGSRREIMTKMQDACEKNDIKKLKVCTLLTETLKYNDLVQK